jgi:hypothetical protein
MRMAVICSLPASAINPRKERWAECEESKGFTMYILFSPENL